MLRLFLNTLTANDKYSLLNRNNAMEPIRIPLSKKPDTFSRFFFFAFLKFILDFEHFEKKDDSHGGYVSEIIDSEKGALIIV